MKIIKSELDLTSGNLFIKVLKMAVPTMLTTIFQLFYTTIDLWTVSNYGGGSLSMTAIGSNSSLINLIITMLLSLALGSNVTIAIAKGANDKDKANRILHTSIMIAFVGGIIFAIIGFFFSPIILSWMDTPDTIIEKASLYLKIYFLGTPFIMIYNFGSQILRALGDSKRPLYFLIFSGLVNVGFDLLFVIVFNMDVSGVALATIISQLVSALLIIYWFYKNPGNSFVELKFKELKIHKEELKEILKIGLPAGIQGVAFCLPNVLIQSSLYTITNYSINGVAISQEEIISGAAASAQIESYLFALFDSFGVSLVGFIGQNYGAKKKNNILKSYWFSIIWEFAFYIFANLVVLLFASPLLRIFITESDSINIVNAINAGKEKLTMMISFGILDGIMHINGSYLRGLKHSTPPAIITILGCSVFRIVFLYTIFLIPEFHTVFYLYAAFPISWLLVNIAYLPTCLYYSKKELSKL